MFIVDSKEIQADDGTNLKILFPADVIEGAKLTFGTVTITPKGRIPLTGTGVHPQDEYSLVIKGSAVTGIRDKAHHLSAGQAALIPAGEAHWSCNEGNEDCEIVWALVPRS